jgi:transposase-like protein
MGIMKKKDLRKAVKLYRMGVPVARIAREYGVSKQAMHQALQRRGLIPYHPRGVQK